MPELEVFAQLMRYTQGGYVYNHALADVSVQLVLSRAVWEALKVQMAETDALIEQGLLEETLNGH